MNADDFSGGPPVGARPDWTIDQDWAAYSQAEHAIWMTLYERQSKLLPGRACDAFLKGLDALDLHRGGIPDFARINEELNRLTGWSVVAVPGLVPDEVFFEHLANRRFPAGRFIRKPDELDYLEEPDVFHDVFGHVPMLTDPTFADYMQAYGQGGLRALGRGQLHNLARLYWYTVEFGLLETPEGLRIYGAGIVSSRAESIFALDDPSPNRLGFDLERVMRTPYRIDDFQQVYFVIPSLKALLNATLQDFAPIYERLSQAPDIAIDVMAPGDRVFTCGTQDYAKTGGRLASA
ncbi:MAG: phenylalanine 4-monooxygenase [Pseudomonadota bacterium]|uniref:phenylalanine 4-monooxygenase n=1 Tax=unclassified Phenylobacterium TaxID=2640670 RepID=UPI0006FEBC38|nr:MULTISPECIES: phenylalanine 4-monooxygenase [unclassified Phenylobacterium]KRB39963.1 phenylalanine-4-hydroxylase [Phenylobacterium sp. Root700]MBT9469602.1 phenylalanine 4-monooxygenase [Phenylobacterium sp.]